MSNFYDSSYWHKGNGLALWNIRKVLALIQAVSDANTPEPFFTVGSNEMTDEWDGMAIASWMTNGINELTIECEGETLMISAMKAAENDPDNKKVLDFEFWYMFGGTEVERSPEAHNGDYNNWSELEEALGKARQWLIDNAADLPKRDLRSLLNIKE